jgi:hypothetical protein
MADTSPRDLRTPSVRGSRAQRVRRTGGLLLALLALLVVIAAGAYRVWRIPGGVVGEDYAAVECRAAYGRARSAADTAAADARRPAVSREQATVARTCRELRLVGALR